MNMTRKLASVVLAMILVLCVATSAVAETGSITVENPIDGQTYTAYKIFDLTYNADKTSVAYTIAANSEWLSAVQSYSGITLTGPITDAEGNTFYNVAANSGFSAAEFALKLKANVEGKTGTALAAENGKAKVDELPLGYYFVTSNTGALCNLTTTNPDASIRDKNYIPFDKVDDDESVELGQTVNYTITGEVPDRTGFKSYVYKVSDTMSDGLTFNKNVTVTVGGVDVTSDCTITYDVNGDANSFTVVLDKIMDYEAGDAIVIKYSATVNENAVAQVEENKANLTYSNDPTKEESTTTTPDDIETVYSAKVIIDKFQTDAESIKLADAKFVLLNDENKYYNLTDNVVTWVDDKTNATIMTTDSNGAAEFPGLEDGTYYLEEVKAPAGYNQLPNKVEVVIAGAATKNAELSYEVEVENQSGTELPSTGGMGTTLFYIAGGVLVVAAFILLVTKRRVDTEK